MADNQQRSSTPSLVAESISEDDTNTLILTSLPTAFFHAEVLAALRAHFESYGSLHTWAPLKGFSRVVMVYYNVEEAGRAKFECDQMVLADEQGKVISTPLRVYRGTHTELFSEADRLPVPHAPHNFLISPPGSPPVGWEPAEEEPPNTDTLASDLVAALERLQLNRARPMKDGVQLIMSPDDDDESQDVRMGGGSPPPRQGLTVFLEDADYRPDEDKAVDGTITPVTEGVWEGEMMRGGIGQVRATVASMQRDGVGTPGGLGTPGGRIARVPTPRPPVVTE
ncbi:carbohydrate-binding module 1 protein [Tulasnella sp. UAMH 9824]|nr:carbohydrate-binding module 1 protein [Tulasnella sp. UAMH 9824]